MLPKENRIYKKYEVEKILRASWRIKNNYLHCLMLSTETQSFRLLTVISKKIYKKAYKRQKIKRRINAIFEELNTEQKLPLNLDVAILVKSKEILELEYETLKKELRDSLSWLYKKLNVSLKTK